MKPIKVGLYLHKRFFPVSGNQPCVPASPLGPSAYILTTPLSQEGPSPVAGLSTDGTGESENDLCMVLDRFEEFDIDDWEWVGEGGKELLFSSSSDNGDIGR